jgi:acyl-CoA synthetase (AMP-forming)/AMP-acid ligase II
VTTATWSVLKSVLLDRAADDPDRLAYAASDGRVTLAELAERAEARAVGLERRGVGPGARVAMVLPAGVAFTEVFWALQLLGAVPCAFAPDPRDRALPARIEAIRPSLVIADADADAPHTPGSPIERSPEPDDLAVLQMTSGTSGEARAVMLTHRAMLAQLLANRLKGEIVSDDVMVSWVPPWHDLGLVRFVIGTVYYGVPCHIVRPSVRTIPEWLQTVERERATVTAAPDFCYRLATHLVPPDSLDLSSLKFTTNGGEPVRTSSCRAFEEHFGLRDVVVPGYGLAEAVCGVASGNVGERLVVDDRGNVACGTPLAGAEVRAGSSVDDPEEILVRAEFVCSGYFDAPEDSARILRDGWLHTGDSGYLDEEGRLFVLGRRAAMIKRGGSAIAPRELEEAAQRVEGVLVAAAVGLPTDAGQDEVAVVLEALAEDPAGRAALVEATSRAVAERLGFAPHRIEVVPSRWIPRTASGKIRYSALRAALEHEA